MLKAVYYRCICACYRKNSKPDCIKKVTISLKNLLFFLNFRVATAAPANERQEVKNATNTYSEFLNIVGGMMPKIISLIAPPPTAVITPKTIIPNTSKFFFIATIAPDIANAIIPISSIIIISVPNVMPFFFLKSIISNQFFWYNQKIVKQKGV